MYKGFNGTPRKLKMDAKNVPPIVKDDQRNRSIPLGMENNSNVCFFNAVVQSFILIAIFLRSCQTLH